MTDRIYDVAVIGAGVGGACAAVALARQGLRVTLLEAEVFPRHKVCGEFVSPEGVAVLERLGVAAIVRDAGARAASQARVIGPRGDSVTTRLPGAGLALSRYRLDATLWQAARDAGVECRDNCHVQRIDGSDRAWVVHAGDDTLQARAVVAAPGRKAAWLDRTQGSHPQPRGTRYIGIKTHLRGARLEPGIVELHCFPGGYCGVLRVEDDLTDVCLLARYDVLRSHQSEPAALWTWLLGQLPALRRCCGGAHQEMPWLATANLTYEGLHPDASGILRVGDAGGYIQPLSGDGMAMAARAGELAAGIIARGLPQGEPATVMAATYNAACHHEFAGRLRWAAALHALLTGPTALSTAALRLGTAVPALAHLFTVRTRG